MTGEDKDPCRVEERNCLLADWRAKRQRVLTCLVRMKPMRGHFRDVVSHGSLIRTAGETACNHETAAFRYGA